MIGKYPSLLLRCVKNNRTVTPCCLFVSPLAERIFKFVAANYGALSGTKFKNTIDEAYDQEGNLTEEGRVKVKEIFTMILQKEIARTYKVPNDAFTAFDRVGNNYITASDIVNSKMAYRLPFKKDELRYFLEQQSIFKRVPRLSIDNFIKYLFPERNRGDT